MRFTLLAGAVLGMDQRTGLFLFGREGASRRLDICRKTLEAHDPTAARDLAEDWLARAGAAWKRRNGVVHHTIAVDAAGISQPEFSKRLTGPAFTHRQITSDEVGALADEMVALADEFDGPVISDLIRDYPWTRPMFGHPPAR